MAKDLNDFIERLRSNFPAGQVNIDREVNCKFEVTGILRKLEQLGKFPAVLFEKVCCPDQQTFARVYTNVTADRRRIAVAAGLPENEWKHELVKGLSRKTESLLDPVTVSAGEAPVKECIHMGQNIDIKKLPFLFHHELDGGHYGTMIGIMKKPEGLGYNVAFHRAMCKDSDKLGVLVVGLHASKIFGQNERAGEPTPFAIVHGHHPMFMVSATIMAPWEGDEYQLAGACLDEPLRLTASETWGENFLVPADAEVIIEGEILPGVREEEGPFGEWTGYYGVERMSPVMKVSAITHKKDYIWYDIDIGHRDFPSIGWEVEAYKRINSVLPDIVTGIHAPYSGRGGFHIYVSIDKEDDGISAIVASAVQTLGYPKLIVVVDKDVDVYNEVEVLNAVATRFQADRDATIIKNVRGSLLDPSMDHSTSHTSLIIDATKPVGAPFPEQVTVPRQVLEDILLENYISRELLNSVD